MTPLREGPHLALPAHDAEARAARRVRPSRWAAQTHELARDATREAAADVRRCVARATCGRGPLHLHVGVSASRYVCSVHSGLPERAPPLVRGPCAVPSTPPTHGGAGGARLARPWLASWGAACPQWSVSQRRARRPQRAPVRRTQWSTFSPARAQRSTPRPEALVCPRRGPRTRRDDASSEAGMARVATCAGGGRATAWGARVRADRMVRFLCAPIRSCIPRPTSVLPHGARPRSEGGRHIGALARARSLSAVHHQV